MLCPYLKEILGVALAASATRNPPAKNQPFFDSLHLTQRLQVIFIEIDTLCLQLDPKNVLAATTRNSVK